MPHASLAPGRIKAIILPNRAWAPDMRAFRPGEAPDPLRMHRLLAARGIELEVLDPLPPPLNPWGRRHALLAGFDPLRALRVLLLRRSANLVISVFESGAAVPLLLRRALGFRAPILLWDVSEASGWRLRQRTLDFVLPRIDGLLALTEVQRSAAKQRFTQHQAAELIGYAIDEEFFHPDFSRDGACVLSVGEDVSRDFPTLIAAMRDSPAELVLKTRQSVEPGPRTRLVPQRLSFIELRTLYADAAIVALPLVPSEHPGGITALFEAMAMGKPVIASDVPTIREFITDGETGLLVPPGDVPALAGAITGLLADPAARRRLGINARRHLERHMSMPVFADRFADAVKKVLKLPAPENTR